MRRWLVVTLIAIVLAPAAPAHAGGRLETNTGASNNGQSVSVQASQVTTSGGGGGSSGGSSGRPAVDHAARFRTLLNAMTLESLREADRRRAEAARYGHLTSTRDHCIAMANHWQSQAYRRVAVRRTIAVTETITVWDRIPVYITRWVPYQTWERVPVRHWYRARVRYGWYTRWVWRSRVVLETRRVTRHRAETHLEWRYVQRSVTRTVHRTVTVWETRYNPFAAIQAAAYRVCANGYGATAASYSRHVQQRRSSWNQQWSRLNQAAHESWKAVNTTCRTVREDGAFDVQLCRFGGWRNFQPGSFERRIHVPPPPPPRRLIEQAKDTITPPGPTIRLNPKIEWEQIVHLPTWMWLEPGVWKPQTARAGAGRAWAEATATPRRVIWDMGNGDRVVCDGPGTPYDHALHERAQRSGCTYTYRQSSDGRPHDAYTVTASIVYDVTWAGSGNTGGGLGTITTADTEQVRVAEIQALIQ